MFSCRCGGFGALRFNSTEVLNYFLNISGFYCLFLFGVAMVKWDVFLDGFVTCSLILWYISCFVFVVMEVFSEEL